MGFRDFASGFKKELVGKPKAKKKAKPMSSAQKGKYYAKKTKSAASSIKKGFVAFAERQAEIGRQERMAEKRTKKAKPKELDLFGNSDSFFR